MFRVSQHPSSGVLKTVPAASGTGHTTCTATPLQRGLIGTGLCKSHKPGNWRKYCVIGTYSNINVNKNPTETTVSRYLFTAGTVFNTHDDGCCDTRNM